MTFPEFAQKLNSLIGGGENTVRFTHSLFETVAPEDADMLAEYSDSSYKHYYNGKTSISKLAKRIMPHLYMVGFEEYIDNQEGDTVQRIADGFSDDIPDIYAGNCGSKLATLFESIILEAAGVQKTVPAPTPAKNSLSEDQEEIMNNIKAGLLVFAKAADAVVHEAAEKSRENKRKHAEEQAQYEKIDAEVVTDEEPEQTKDSGGNTTIIQHQNNVVQNGDNNVNITNNGTLNLNL